MSRYGGVTAMGVVEVFAIGTDDFGCETKGCRQGLEACSVLAEHIGLC